MEKTEMKQFFNIMATAYKAFGEKEPDQARLAIYFDFLKDIPIRTIEDAMNKILRTRKYSSVPTIAEILEAATGGEAEIESAVLGYWSRATRLISRSQYGDGDRVLDEMVIMAFGSWAQFGETEMDNTPSDRKHFLSCARDVLRRHLEHLALNGGVEVKRLAEGGRA
jgi:hypothetical protein